MEPIPPILSARGLHREFNGFVAVHRVDLSVRAGTVHSLIGPNGAGKSTLFNLLTKFVAPTSGQIVFKGRDITSNTPAEVARLGMVRSFQISSVFPHLTVYENVRVALQSRHKDTFRFWRSEKSLHRFDERAHELMTSVGIDSLWNRRAAELPYGRKRALELATTLALDPDVILLDEPMAGMGQEDIDRTARLISGLRGGCTVLMVEHNLGVVADISDTITVLRRGEVIAEGDYATVSANEEVRRAYMGGRHA